MYTLKIYEKTPYTLKNIKNLQQVKELIKATYKGEKQVKLKGEIYQGKTKIADLDITNKNILISYNKYKGELFWY